MSNTRVLITMLCCLLFVTACQVGKQPVRRKVKMVDNKSYGIITVDTFGGKPVNTVSGKESSASTATTPVKLGKDKQKLADKLMPLFKKQTSFTTFSGKAKMHYQALGQKNEFTATFRVQKDKIIWISVSAFGGIVNVARAYITPDSVKLVNFLQKEAYRMPIQDINKLLPVPVDFNTMQNLIIGNVLDTEVIATDATEFGGTMSLQVTHKDMIQQATYGKPDNDMRTLQMRTADDKTQGMMKFGNYENVSNRRFATSRDITLTHNGEPYYIDMNFNDATFDQKLEFPFSIPKNYTMK